METKVVYPFEDFSKNVKRHQRKVVLPIAATAVTRGIKVTNRNRNLKRQEDLQDLYCYDRSLGHYWKLKKKLANDEWLEIDRRKKNGEHLSDILSELKVLK